ncbi:response regulator transcription factor [Eubacterium sp.]
MKKILIIEDDETIRSELQKLLTNSGYEAQITDTFSNVKEQIGKIKPDLILLDINLPELNGEVILKEIRKESDIPVVMVTSRTSEVDEVLSMSYGADDFITKPYNPTVLLLRIQNIFKRMTRTGERQMYNDLEVNFSKSTICDGQTEIRLTKNEMIVFSFLLTNRGKIVTRDDLMTDLWNNEEYINDNALTVNISRLRNKLAEIGYEGAIETRKGQGYILL